MARTGCDLTWDTMCDFAERLNRSGRADSLKVRPIRRLRWFGALRDRDCGSVIAGPTSTSRFGTGGSGARSGERCSR